MAEFEAETTVVCSCPNCTGGSILRAIKLFFTRRLSDGCGTDYEQQVTVDIEPQEDDRYAQM